MAGRVEWNPEEFKRKLDQAMVRRLNASAIIVEDHAKRLLSVAGTSVAATAFIGNGIIGKMVAKETKTRVKDSAMVNGKVRKITRTESSITYTGKVYKAGRRIYGSNPSKPGEPPHKQKGDLRASVTHERDGSRLLFRVGTNKEYGRWLELGTANMAARPWLRRALIDQARRIRNILIARLK